MHTVQVIDSDPNMTLDHQMIVYSNFIVAKIRWYTWYTQFEYDT